MMFARRESKAIAEFWQWWPRVRTRIEAAIRSGQWGDLVDEVNNRVAPMHPDLQWEFAKGSRAAHALVVSSGGDPRMRATAARWYSAAPAADDDWEYHPARQPDPAAFASSTLELAGHRVALREARFALVPQTDRCEIDVVCHHPVFADAPEDVCRQVTFLALDWLLGEAAVELWIGAVAWQSVLPADAQPPQVLAAQVSDLAAHYAKPVWALLSARAPDGYPVMATIQQPLKPARYPRFDSHLAVVLPYQPDNVGLPTDESLQALRAFEDRLPARLGSGGALVAHETSRGHRTFHIYADTEGSAAQALRAAATGWGGRKAVVRQSPDPSFERVAHLRP